MAGRERRHENRSNVEFLFRRTEILMDRPPIGRGSYGEVRYARCDSLICAAKCVHTIFVDAVREGQGDDPIRSFQQEYEWLSIMKHPNIVQYLGYHIDRKTNVPYILMELMDESLTHYLERLTTPVPFHKTIDFSHDIAMGLDYLHYNGIMHRDLSSNNILMIAGYRAKITDFGQSAFATAESDYRIRGELTPGTVVYMPPEALREPPIYSSRLDNFSFGVLMIQILTRKWPEPSEATAILPGIGPGGVDAEIPVKEVVRRRSHLAMVDHRHPLYQLALYCIKDDDEERPEIIEICNRLREVKEEIPEYKESQMENPVEPIKDGQIKVLQNQIQTKEQQDQIQRLQKQIERMDGEALQMMFAIEKKDAMIEQLGIGADNRPGPGLEPYNTPSNHPGTQSSSPNTSLSSSTPLPVPDLQLGNKRFKWFPCTKSPAPLYGGSAIAIGNRAYVTGQALNAIYEFNPDTNRWATLPTAPTASFALVSVAGVLTTVGGYDKRNYSNALYSLVKNQERLVWQQNLPPMKDSRISPGADSNGRFVVVAGGEAQVPGNRLLSNSVEIMDLQTKAWSVADRLPKPVKRLSLTLCGDRVCILGGISHQNKPLSEMFTAVLSTLVTSAAQRNVSGDLSRAFKFGNCWQTSGVPLVYGTCTTLGSCILSVGGWDTKLSNAVYMFNPATQAGHNPWHFIGQLPKARMDAVCTVLPGDRLLVVGGRGQDQEPVLNAAEIACPV